MTTCSTSASGSDSDSENEVQAVSSSASAASDNHTDATGDADKFDVEDNIPLQELKNELTNAGKMKYVFKSKSFELIKRKHSRVFKCTRCDTTEKSQQRKTIIFVKLMAYWIAKNAIKLAIWFWH